MPVDSQAFMTTWKGKPIDGGSSPLDDWHGLNSWLDRSGC